jgi:hypothetical protein
MPAHAAMRHNADEREPELNVLYICVRSVGATADGTESASIRRCDWIALLLHYVINPARRLTTNNRRSVGWLLLAAGLAVPPRCGHSACLGRSPHCCLGVLTGEVVGRGFQAAQLRGGCSGPHRSAGRTLAGTLVFWPARSLRDNKRARRRAAERLAGSGGRPGSYASPRRSFGLGGRTRPAMCRPFLDWRPRWCISRRVRDSDLVITNDVRRGQVGAVPPASYWRRPRSAGTRGLRGGPSGPTRPCSPWGERK